MRVRVCLRVCLCVCVCVRLIYMADTYQLGIRQELLLLLLPIAAVVCVRFD